MSEKKLTGEEFLEIQLHYAEQKLFAAQKQIMDKEKEILKYKAELAQVIKKNAEFEIAIKNNAIIDFNKKMKSHQENYELGVKQKIKDRLKIAAEETFEYSPDTLEVTIKQTNRQTTDKEEGN